MAMSASLQWMLIATFLLTGTYCLVRCARFTDISVRHPASAWTTELAHLLMSAAMVGMISSVRRWDRANLQLTVFAVFAGWFAVRALVGPVPSPHPAIGATRPALVNEAVASAAMCWMLRPAGSGGAAMNGHPMAMSMTASLSAGARSTVTVVLSAALMAGAGGWGWQLWRVAGRVASGDRPGIVAFGPAGEAAFQVIMAAGMAVAVLAMH